MLSRETCARLFTFQRACVLELFDTTGRYQPTWEGIAVSGKDRLAYSHVSSHLKSLGLSDGLHPPLWTYETTPENLDLLAVLLLSEFELEQYDYVTLELSVPESRLLRSSYGAWCALYFDCLETGTIDDDGRWLDWRTAHDDRDDTVQAILPFLLKDWIIDAKPLKVSSDI